MTKNIFTETVKITIKLTELFQEHCKCNWTNVKALEIAFSIFVNKVVQLINWIEKCTVLLEKLRDDNNYCQKIEVKD